jgi:HK97 family phage portal protein
MQREKIKPFEFPSDKELSFLTSRKQQFYTRLGASAASIEYRSVGLKQVEAWQAMFPSSFDNVGTNGTLPSVSVPSAQRIATVFTCLNVRGETVGSLPFSSKINTKTGAVTEYASKVHRLIHDRPNPNITAFDFWSTVEKWKLAWGNAYVEIIRDSSYEPIQFELREPWEVQMKETESNEVYYVYDKRIIRSTDMLHFKNYSLDGECGISSIKQNALTMGMSLKLSQYNSSLIGERPYGYLTSEKKPKDLQQKGEMRSSWDKRGSFDDEKDFSEKSTVKTVGGIPYLSGGLEFKSFTLPADDVAYIEASKMTDQDIYAIFRIPPIFAQNYERAPYNSSEQQDIVFAKYTLASIRAIEQECTEKLYPESNKKTNQRFAKFSMQGLLRGDTNTRKEFYTGLFNIAAITANQICEFEDLPTYGPDGDKHYVQGALVPVDMLADVLKGKTAQPAQSRSEIEGEVKKLLREQMKTKLNGHYADIAEFLN